MDAGARLGLANICGAGFIFDLDEWICDAFADEKLWSRYGQVLFSVRFRCDCGCVWILRVVSRWAGKALFRLGFNAPVVKMTSQCCRIMASAHRGIANFV